MEGWSIPQAVGDIIAGLDRVGSRMKGEDLTDYAKRQSDIVHQILQRLVDGEREKAATWADISTAPKDGTPFMALNHDNEVWVSKYSDDGRIMFRTNYRRDPRKFEIVTVNGEELLREDKAFAVKNECWESNWSLWARLYEFKPTHWMPLPPPPETEG